MNNTIVVTGSDGEKFEAEVLDIFKVKGYESKDYILYTRNREVDENHIEVFVSILEKNGNSYLLHNIEDNHEWEMVQKAMDEMGDL